jgi:ppGpp synthetase/RelA/SpoT-type nucleotidyltranferase
MNKEKVLEIVNDVIVDKLSQLTEEMSSNEFVEMIIDKLHEVGIKVETDEDEEQIRDIIGSRILPLVFKICEWGIGKNIPIE